MDFELSKTQKEIQKAVREFAKGEFDKDLALELEQRHEFPRKIWEKAGDLGLKGRIDPKLTSMAKMYAARTAVEVADEAIQLLGGYGYMAEYEVERFYRDAKITEIYEGTKEIQKDTIAGALLGKMK